MDICANENDPGAGEPEENCQAHSVKAPQRARDENKGLNIGSADSMANITCQASIIPPFLVVLTAAHLCFKSLPYTLI